MKFIINNIAGSKILLVVILPVYSINDTNIGINEFINPTKFVAVSFTIDITSEKLFIITVTIAMYCT